MLCNLVEIFNLWGYIQKDISIMLIVLFKIVFSCYLIGTDKDVNENDVK